jgi:threonine dehydrogenase-like Zn-dependent dehydrogenase
MPIVDHPPAMDQHPRFESNGGLRATVERCICAIPCLRVRNEGLQAEYARIQFAGASLVNFSKRVRMIRLSLMSDILPASYMATFITMVGCGPVGQFAIVCAHHLGAGRIFAVDSPRRDQGLPM